MTTIDYATAKAKIEAVAKAKPNHTTGGPFASCHYLEPDGSPSCIVGTAFYEELLAAGLTPDHRQNDESVDSLVTNGLLDLTPKAEYFLTSAQSAQDFGDVWAEAYRKALDANESYTEDGGYIYDLEDDDTVVLGSN